MDFGGIVFVVLQSATAYEISSKSDHTSLKYCHIMISKIAVDCHFENHYCRILHLYCKISQKSENLLPSYGNVIQ